MPDLNDEPIIVLDRVTGRMTISPRWRAAFRELLEAQYLSRYINLWRIGRALPPFPGPEPQPGPPYGSSALYTAQNILNGDLLLRALGEPQPRPSKFSVIELIRKENIHVEVIKDLISQFESGLDALRDELKVFESNTPQSCS